MLKSFLKRILSDAFPDVSGAHPGSEIMKDFQSFVLIYVGFRILGELQAVPDSLRKIRDSGRQQF